jgi:5-formyltetrahydrofolate cyclo-ligase
VKLSLRSLTSENIQSQSNLIFQKLLSLPEIEQSRAPCAYLSMPHEVQTETIVRVLLETKEQLYIPKVIGPKAEDMTMISINSYETIATFPKNNWGIPEPPEDMMVINDEDLVNIDFVIVPGVAFDSKCGRLGHGKGYYGNNRYLKLSLSDSLTCFNCYHYHYYFLFFI